MAPSIVEPDGTRREGSRAAPRDLVPLDLDGAVLDFVRVDHQTRLQLGGTEIVIETPFSLTVGGATHLMDPEDRGGLGPLLALYPDDVETAWVDDDGQLAVAFLGGAVLLVPPHPRYESWHVLGPGRRRLVCGAGGALVSVFG